MGGCGGSMSLGDIGDWTGVGRSGSICFDSNSLPILSESSKLVSVIFGIASIRELPGDFFT